MTMAICAWNEGIKVPFYKTHRFKLGTVLSFVIPIPLI